jgi:hypothetical protein
VTIATAAGVPMTGTPDEVELAELYAESTSLSPAVCLALVQGGVNPERQSDGFDFAGRAALENHYPFTKPDTVTT